MTGRTSLLVAAVILAIIAVWGLGGVARAFVASPVGLTSVPGQAEGNNPVPAAPAPLGPVGFDCSQIEKLGIDKQLNWRAAQILARCGRAPQVPETRPQNPISTIVNKLISPFTLGGVDADVILPDGTYPYVTQSEAMGWGNGSTVVVSYNDGRAAPNCASGVSYSTDGGINFQHNGQPMCSGHGTTFGDPILVFNAALNTWFAGTLVGGCGGQGIGLWTSPDGINWTVGACAHNGTFDDRESMWVDNNPSSPHYGRMYISWNNFIIGGMVQMTHSDDGTTWSAPVNATAGFIRNVQLTGDLLGSGAVYSAGMDVGVGGLDYRINHMYRSTDGGDTWTDSVMGAAFRGPGRAIFGGWPVMFSTIWRHEGWGQPAAVGSTVHYAFTGCGQNITCSGATDHGDIYYVRSTDAGATWSTPLKMNLDAGTAAQWQPSLAATAAGGVYIGWYDEREVNGGADLDCSLGNMSQPCYKRYGAISLDNGVTWQTDAQVGDVNSPLPVEQPDIPLAYEGDYDYISSSGDVVYDHWTDGRVPINSTSQQDVFLDRIDVIVGTPTPTPTGTPPTATNTPTATQTPCGANGTYIWTTGTGTIVPGTTFLPGSNCDDCVNPIPIPFTFALYGQAYNSVNASSNGNLQFTTTVNSGDIRCLPSASIPSQTIFMYWHNLRLTGTGDGIYYSTSGSAPNRILNIEWRGIYYPGGGRVNLETRLFENGEANQYFQTIYAQVGQGNTSTTVGVERDSVNYTQYVCNGVGGPITAGLMLTWTQPPCGGATATPTPVSGTVTPGATFTPSATPTLCTISFSDVNPGDYFYEAVMYLACHGVISGYSDGTFRPYNDTTRGQLSKIVVLAREWPIVTPTGTPTFRDVPASNPFYAYIETAYDQGVISGYSCGTGCLEFRWANNITRGQLTKVIVLAMNWPITPPSTPTFIDVPLEHPFFGYIETAYAHQIISGYSCGTDCLEFRPYNNATRGQIAKIVYNAITGP